MIKGIHSESYFHTTSPTEASNGLEVVQITADVYFAGPPISLETVSQAFFGQTKGNQKSPYGGILLSSLYPSDDSHLVTRVSASGGSVVTLHDMPSMNAYQHALNTIAVFVKQAVTDVKYRAISYRVLLPSNYSLFKPRGEHNQELLDVLTRAGFHATWRDNYPEELLWAPKKFGSESPWFMRPPTPPIHTSIFSDEEAPVTPEAQKIRIRQSLSVMKLDADVSKHRMRIMFRRSSQGDATALELDMFSSTLDPLRETVVEHAHVVAKYLMDVLEKGDDRTLANLDDVYSVLLSDISYNGDDSDRLRAFMIRNGIQREDLPIILREADWTSAVSTHHVV